MANKDNTPITYILERIGTLEREVESLRSENDSLKLNFDKYKTAFDTHSGILYNVSSINLATLKEMVTKQDLDVSFLELCLTDAEAFKKLCHIRLGYESYPINQSEENYLGILRYSGNMYALTSYSASDLNLKRLDNSIMHYVLQPDLARAVAFHEEKLISVIKEYLEEVKNANI